MAKFGNTYRRVVAANAPLALRTTNFKHLVEAYCLLTGASFQATYARVSAVAGFSWDRLPTPEQLVAAADALRIERDQFLRQMHARDTLRRQIKANRRQPSS
jgi:hypothetical protein